MRQLSAPRLISKSRKPAPLKHMSQLLFMTWTAVKLCKTGIRNSHTWFKSYCNQSLQQITSQMSCQYYNVIHMFLSSCYLQNGRWIWHAYLPSWQWKVFWLGKHNSLCSWQLDQDAGPLWGRKWHILQEMGDMSENANCTNLTAVKLDEVETQYTTE